MLMHGIINQQVSQSQDVSFMVIEFFTWYCFSGSYFAFSDNILWLATSNFLFWYAGAKHLYKNLLQSLAQKRNLTLPIYFCERVGLLHASRFRCKVRIGTQTFESQEFFTNTKEAEHAAAKVALMSLSLDGIQEACLLIICGSNFCSFNHIFLGISDFLRESSLLWLFCLFFSRMALVSTRTFYKNSVRSRVVLYQFMLQPNLVNLMRQSLFQLWR